MAVRVARSLLLLTLLLISITLTSGLGPPKKYAGEACAKKEECWAKRTTPGCDCTGGKCTTQCMGNGRSGPKAAKSAKAAGPKPTILQGGQCKAKTDCIKIKPSAKKCFCSYNGKGDKKICRGKNCKPNPAAPKPNPATPKKKTKKVEKKAVKKAEKKVIKTPEKKAVKKAEKKVIKTPEKKAVKKAKKKVSIPKAPDSPLSKKKVVKTCKKNKDCPGMFCKCFRGECRGKCKKGNGISNAQFGDFDDELYDDELYDDELYDDALYNDELYDDELYGEELYDNDIDSNSNYIPEFSVMFISIITLCLCGVFCIGLSVIMGLCGWYIGKYVLQYSQNNKNYKLIQRDGITDIEQNNE